MNDLLNDEKAEEPKAIKELAEKIEVPTLVLWGKDDKVS